MTLPEKLKSLMNFPLSRYAARVGILAGLDEDIIKYARDNGMTYADVKDMLNPVIYGNDGKLFDTLSIVNPDAIAISRKKISSLENILRDSLLSADDPEIKARHDAAAKAMGYYADPNFEYAKGNPDDLGYLYRIMIKNPKTGLLVPPFSSHYTDAPDSGAEFGKEFTVPEHPSYINEDAPRVIDPRTGRLRPLASKFVGQSANGLADPMFSLLPITGSRAGQAFKNAFFDPYTERLLGKRWWQQQVDKLPAWFAEKYGDYFSKHPNASYQDFKRYQDKMASNLKDYFSDARRAQAIDIPVRNGFNFYGEDTPDVKWLEFASSLDSTVGSMRPDYASGISNKFRDANLYIVESKLKDVLGTDEMGDDNPVARDSNEEIRTRKYTPVYEIPLQDVADFLDDGFKLDYSDAMNYFNAKNFSKLFGKAKVDKTLSDRNQKNLQADMSNWLKRNAKNGNILKGVRDAKI